MKIQLRLNSTYLAYLFGGVLLLGAGVSAFMTKDLRWMNWHFSRLGEGGTLSSVIFNVAVFVSAIIMFYLSYALSDDTAHITKITSVDLIKAKAIINRAFNAVAICLIGVSLFPFDRFPMIHDFFGYSMLFIFLALCITTQKVLPIYSRQFYLYCNLIILGTVVCYTLFFGLKVITLLTVEFILFTFLYVWLIYFIKGIRETNT